ncbi:hypothetical protein VT84_14105 [Gemmata sp. SH-PL17]|uniref:hypothetical protein n=1 Tax=Gemmata sp. SH-PL17 TaxID=1630693 RepID=UPI00078B6495|nr:hypothetical protein [Gemmata sp. SH-PL17]AMV25527.1 hypothetical protein VT84_14105 [Gemmata sp. SH-PL17]
MPLSSFDLQANVQFAFTVPVANWADLTQGDNQVVFSLPDLDTDVWDDAYAAVLTIASSASTTIDLKSFTNLAGESVALTKALAIVVKVAGTSGVLKITPGASNGLVWFAGSTDGHVVRAGESFTQAGDPTGSGITVDSTHKTLTFANTGATSITVTVAIVGSTL